jgi:hypothetical protein
MAEERWLIVLGPDGAVIGVAGGGPTSWIGSAIESIDELPLPVREAGRRTVNRTHHPSTSIPPPCGYPVPELPGAPVIEMIAVEAIPMRRVIADPRKLLASSMEVLGRQAQNLDVDLKIEAEGELPAGTRLDPEKIAWAVSTLVGNALRYVRRGTRLMPGGWIHVKLSVAPDNGDLVITVQDDGPGIPEDKLPWLFRRARGTTHAAGLGLMLVHDVVTAHGGSIHVQSVTKSVDHGTTITLRIPAH